MSKEITTLLGIDGIGMLILFYYEPTFVKWVLIIGLVSALVIFYFTRQGRISVYASQLAMGISLAIHFA